MCSACSSRVSSCACVPQEAVESYKQIHPGFDGTRELKLIMVTCKPSLSYCCHVLYFPHPSPPLPSQDLLVACEEEDTDKFADIVSMQDSESGGMRADGRKGWAVGDYQRTCTSEPRPGYEATVPEGS